MTKYKNLTPLRAAELLKEIPHHIKDLTDWRLGQIRDALHEHVAAALVCKNRRVKK